MLKRNSPRGEDLVGVNMRTNPISTPFYYAYRLSFNYLPPNR